MVSNVSGKGIDHYKWHRLLSEKASTVKMASLVYERENCVVAVDVMRAREQYR